MTGRSEPGLQAVVPPHTAFVGLGANLGDARATLMLALERLAALPQTRLVRHSSLYRTAPIDSHGPDYLNAVAELATDLSPQDLLQALQALELAAGRERPYRNAPRTLDLDLLLYDDRVLDTPTLTLPHPRMHLRAFVLQPLAEVWPEQVSASQLAAVQNQAIQRISLQDLP